MTYILSASSALFALFMAFVLLKDQRALNRYRDAVGAWIVSLRVEMDEAGWISKGSLDKIVDDLPVPTPPRGIKLGKHGLPPAVEADLEQLFDSHNKEYLLRQKKRRESFFRNVERNPLTAEQIEACVCMDDNVQIVAAAGSGKTSTMVAKAGYAMLEGIAEPEEILLLAFNRDAAEELGDRIRDRLSGMPGVENVTAKTFNAFGMAVIGSATNLKRSVPMWVSEAGEDTRMISRIIDDLSASDPGFAIRWAMYRTVFARDLGKPGEPEAPDTYDKGTFGFRAASGDLVKSMEELAIANWLFFNGIEFEYETPYEHKVADAEHVQYRPDFRYPGIDLYHEHFALDQQGRAPAHFRKYVEGVEWKRRTHEEKGTSLIETHSWQVRSGEAFRKLDEELRRRGVVPTPDPNKEPVTRPYIDNIGMAMLIRSFQQHAKSNGLDTKSLRANAEKHAVHGYGARIRAFMEIYEAVSEEWDRRLRLEDGVDWEDMLIMAAELIEQGRYRSPYTLVLADEFQDSSRSRVRLLKALTACRDDVRLCVVGDDWQGINRFAGADISVMTEFENEFENSTRMALTTTFRCPQELCDASSEFVQANPVQIRKTVRTTNERQGNSMVAFGYNDPDRAGRHLQKRLERLHAHQSGSDPDDPKLKILLLGRYKSDRPVDLELWQRRFGDRIAITFKTVHSSKGTEADYVVILNLQEKPKSLSFPSTREDDPILQIPMPEPDPFPLAEERRLFYVALTRAKRQVWLYADTVNQSRFVRELMKNRRVKMTQIDGEAAVPCPKCGKGSMVARSSEYGSFISCSQFPACNHKTKA